MKRLIFASTLHDPTNNLARVVSFSNFRHNLGYIQGQFRCVDYEALWAVSATPKTNTELLEKLEAVDANIVTYEGGVEANHVNALKQALNYIDDGNVVQYIDGDRLMQAILFFPNDLVNMQRVVLGMQKTALDSKDESLYVTQLRSRDAFNTHTSPMTKTESITNRCYSDVLKREVDPGSTMHAFSPESLRYVIEENDKRPAMIFPHAKWLLIMAGKYGKDKFASIHSGTGMVGAYETYLQKLDVIDPNEELNLCRLSYTALLRLADAKGVKRKIEQDELVNRKKIAIDWLNYLKENTDVYIDDENREKIDKVLSDELPKVEDELAVALAKPLN